MGVVYICSCVIYVLYTSWVIDLEGRAVEDARGKARVPWMAVGGWKRRVFERV